MVQSPIDHLLKERITDISNRLCAEVEAGLYPESLLLELWDYHSNPQRLDLYPMSNWRSHRIRCLACIARQLLDTVKAFYCHYLVLEWLIDLSPCHDRCGASSQDWHWRDSAQYLVYGLQAVVNACIYIKPITKYNYAPLFVPHRVFLAPYISGSKKHLEYVRSKVASDKQKPEYAKPWDPKGADTLLRLLKQLD